MECIYCKQWSISPIIEKIKNKIKKICQLKKENIHSKYNNCNLFSPSKYFYCNKQNSRIKIEQCINRQKIVNDKNNKKKKYYTDCKKCKQANTITNIYELFYNNRKIKRRNKPCIKIKKRK